MEPTVILTLVFSSDTECVRLFLLSHTFTSIAQQLQPRSQTLTKTLGECDAPVSQNPYSPPFSLGHRLHLLRLSLPLRSDAPRNPISHFSICGSIPNRILRPSLRQSNPSLQVYISHQIPRKTRCRAPIYEADWNHRAPHQSSCVPGPAVPWPSCGEVFETQDFRAGGDWFLTI